jgi:hypothetical protein
MEPQAHGPRRTARTPSRGGLGRPSHRRLATKSHCFTEFYLRQKCHCSPRGLERIVLTVTRYDRCTRNAVPAGHLRREYPMRGEDSNHRAARRWH